jgi:uncharacterized protein
LSIYLLFAIGFKGGVAVADHGIDGPCADGAGGGCMLSFALPFAAFALLRVITRISSVYRRGGGFRALWIDQRS